MQGCWDGAGAPAPFSESAAKNAFRTAGKNLRMDSTWTWYAGDRGKIHLYFLDAWLKGAPWNPSVRPFNRLCFTLGLTGVFFAAWWTRRPLLGFLVALFVGSSPYQLYEVYARENVHGWTITTALILFAIHLPLLGDQRQRPVRVFAFPMAVGVLMATIRTFRSEPMALMVSAMAMYWLVQGLSRTRRLGMIGALLLSFWITGQAWNRYFVKKHEETRIAVAAVGGHPYPSEIRLYHHFWHPIWCGLGDFDTKYGYT